MVFKPLLRWIFVSPLICGLNQLVSSDRLVLAISGQASVLDSHKLGASSGERVPFWPSQHATTCRPGHLQFTLFPSPFVLQLPYTFLFISLSPDLTPVHSLTKTSSKRERSRSPRRGRSRSPTTRRSYSPRDRSRSRHRRRSRTPMTGQGAPAGGQGIGYTGPPHRTFEDRAAHREQVMNNIRETSQQDRRVYVGNLSYDVKWHHLKDFMRQGMS